MTQSPPTHGTVTGTDLTPDEHGADPEVRGIDAARQLLQPREVLRWRHTSSVGTPGEMELVRDGGEVVGEVGPALSDTSSAWGECFGEEWELALCQAFMRGYRGSLRESGTARPGLSYKGGSLSRGFMTTPEGRGLRWSKRFTGGWRVTDRAGQEVVRITVVRGWSFNTDAEVRLRAGALALDELPQLLILCGVLVIQTQDAFSRTFRVLKGTEPWAERDAWPF